MEYTEAGFWTDRNVFVTGASGLLGSALTEELLWRGAHVVTLMRDWVPESKLIETGMLARTRMVRGELEDLGVLMRAINEYEVDTVFHLGAQTVVGAASRSPLSTFEANIRGTYNLLEVCRRHADAVDRIVVASSDKAYGETDALPYTEELPLAARHPYEVSKACADMIALSYHHTYGLPVAVARCGNIYGGGDLNWSRIVPGTIRALLGGERPVIRSDGSFVRDYIYVRDAASAYVDIAESLDKDGVAGQAFNFSDEQPRTVLELVGAIMRLMDRDDLEPVVLDRAVGEIHDQTLAAAKARSVLGWSARYTLEEGLGETIGWYRAHLG